MKAFNISLMIMILAVMNSCVSHQKRNSDLVVTYQGKIVHTASSKYNTENELKKELNDNKGPDFVIFSADWCPACKLLLDFLQDTNLKQHAIVLNLDEEWVKFIAAQVGITGIPAMIETRDGGRSQVPIIFGTMAIAERVARNHKERL